METSIFEYKGVKITFEFSEGSKMINATEMAKAFEGKNVGGKILTFKVLGCVNYLP